MNRLKIDILDEGRVIKTVGFDLANTTRAAMLGSFTKYWDRYYGHQTRYSWLEQTDG